MDHGTQSFTFLSFLPAKALKQASRYVLLVSIMSCAPGSFLLCVKERGEGGLEIREFHPLLDRIS